VFTFPTSCHRSARSGDSSRQFVRLALTSSRRQA
jgi:hypothetical protein